MLAVTAPVFASVVPDTRGMLPQERYTYSVPDELSGSNSAGGAGPGPLRRPLPARPGGRAPGPIRPRRRPPHLRRHRRRAAALRGPAGAGGVDRRSVLRAASRGPQGDGAQGGAEHRGGDRPASRTAHDLRGSDRRPRPRALPLQPPELTEAQRQAAAPLLEAIAAGCHRARAAPRGHRQRQDRGLPGRHRRRPGPGPPGDLPGPGDRPDPPDDPPLRRPLPRAAGREPFRAHRRRARGRMAPGPPRRDRRGGGLAQRRLRSAAPAGGGGGRRGGRLRLQAGPDPPLPRRRRGPRAGPAGRGAGGAGQRHPPGGDLLPGPHRRAWS